MGRKDCVREIRLWQYAETARPSGYDILINGSNHYINFNTISGVLWYGFRDNSWTMEYKNNGWIWQSFGSWSWWSQTLEQTLIQWNNSNWQSMTIWIGVDNTTIGWNWSQTMSWYARPRNRINHEWFVPIFATIARIWWWIWSISIDTIWTTPEFEQLDQWSWSNYWRVYHAELPRNHRSEQLPTNFVLPTWIDMWEDSEIRVEIHRSTADQEGSGIVVWKIYYQIANPIRCCDTETTGDMSYENYEDVFTLYDCDLWPWNRWLHHVTIYNWSWTDSIGYNMFQFKPWCLIRMLVLRDVWWEDTFHWDVSLDALKLAIRSTSLWRPTSDRPDCKKLWKEPQQQPSK